MNDEKRKSFQDFGLKEIAGWALDDYWSGGDYAALPPIQRGFVWKAEQIERLWDSIARGFPVGSLLMGPADNRGRKHFSGCSKQEREKQPAWFLLDGQQRATSIIKGFQDMWSNPKDGENDASSPVSALWVDLAPKGMEKTDRRFLFRLVTKSHPWGYTRTKMERLTASAANKALQAFRAAPVNGEKKPHEFGLHEVFPWDAEAPVPLALLLQSIEEDGCKTPAQVAEQLLKKLKSVKLWQGDNVPEKLKESMRVLDKCLSGEQTHFSDLVEALRNALMGYRIPAPILDIGNGGAQKDGRGDSEQSDETHVSFVLFDRINTSGTTLSRDDLRYSMLKSKWPKAPSIIEGTILKERQLCDPARMASLMARLYLMLKDMTPDGKARQSKGLQAELSLAQFESLLRNQRDEFQGWLDQEGPAIVESAWKLLVRSGEGDCGLPKVLAADITKHHQDLMLVLLYWLARIDANRLSDEQRRRTIGFITAVAWYAVDEGLCVRVIANKLHEACHVDSFNRDMFAALLGVDERGRTRMLRLPAPDNVESALRSPWGGGDLPAYQENGADFWNKKEFWGLYPMPGDDEEASSWYQESDDARRLLHAIFDAPKWRGLLYAQRGFVEDHFGWFDPTQPDAISERNRPWDYDHILPKAWVNYKRLPKLIRTWLSSIGNFRVWPMECNRSKQDGEMFEEKAIDYDLKNMESVMQASFVDSRPDSKWMELSNLINGKHFWDIPEAWHVFVEAAMSRTVDIYREWYDQLRVAELSSTEG